ncbi:hypothetical protein M0R88_05970 [Halorussus gelatinilyticus]|uniref:Uncharacterized protein n=1 Tax=Halorussus gelatinilyticus TaxID=2937524 RepID=A0A8U0ILT3_9EURY|nr:hypothetical protein [Halorussus gelatinilyticus]UPW01646.1 hypothetical protein M0R88_05970 [Halorussus gelatinilyticus]
MTSNLTQALWQKLERERGEQSIDEIADEMTHDPDVDAPIVEPEDVEAVARDLGVEDDFDF